jgi:hypothetical protein
MHHRLVRTPRSTVRYDSRQLVRRGEDGNRARIEHRVRQQGDGLPPAGGTRTFVTA